MDKRAFHRDGFLGPLPRFASTELLDAAAELLSRVEREKLAHPLYGRYSPRDWHLVDGALRELLTHPALVEVAVQLVGEDLTLWRSKSFIKPPFGGELGWHQEWGPFDGAEIGNNVPALQPAVTSSRPWNISIWIALADIDERMGPLRFIPGSHTKHYPVDQVPLPESAFFEDPFVDIDDPMEIVRRARDATLLLDVDTSSYFEGVALEGLTLAAARDIVLARASELTGEIMLPVGVDLEEYRTVPMRKGEYVVFFERTLHGSGVNETGRPRPAVNCRVTPTSTLVYPQRLAGNYIDGSNINIRAHRCVLLSGCARNPDNVYLDEFSG